MTPIAGSTPFRYALPVAGVLLFGLLQACGGGDSSAPEPKAPAPAKVASVTVTPGTATIDVGATTSLSVVIRDAAGATLSGRTVSWTSAAPNVATVNGSGVVTGVSAGTAMISATSEGVTGSANITVIAPTANFAVVSGNDQRGLVGRPLADSLTVRVATSGGTGMANVPVSWTTGGGTLSAASTVTNSQGVARVQWSPTAGDVTATALIEGAAPATFRANGRPSGACVIAPNAQTQRFSLGATDFTLSLRATQPLRIAVVYVDFPELAASETPLSLMTSIVNPGLQMLRDMSYGRINITAVSFPTWYRMPRALASYDWTTYAGHREYLLDVLSVTNPSIDFSTFDALYVFTPPSTAKITSPTFNGGTTAGVVADGRNFGNAVTFGLDVRSFGPAIVAHETGHMLGLVDLYAYTPAGGTDYPGNQFKYVGAWSVMSNVFNPGHFLAWEKRKLGFIDEQQVDCLDGAGGVEAVITPNQATGGLKMVGVMLDASSALVVEVRNALGVDANLCAQGVLLYVVDARIASGQGAAQVIGSRVTTSGTAFNKCGPWADATFGFGTNPVSTYTHVGAGTTVTVLGQDSNGAYRVRVKRQ